MFPIDATKNLGDPTKALVRHAKSHGTKPL